MKNFITSLIGAVVGCIIFTIILFFVNPSVFTKNNQTATIDKKEVAPIVINSSSIPEATEKIMHSVVNIDTKSFTKVEQPVVNIFGIPAFRSQIVPQQGSGSGVLIDNSGLVLTNEHVIHGATEITVTFQNDESYSAFVKGADPISDIALLQIKFNDRDNSDMQPAILGDSDKLRIGEPVIAVGSPYHFQQSVTYGVISARGRNLSDQSKDFQDLLQTDAAINPGNSGGPLVNLKGEVIGINTAIIPYAQGIGFSIPINTVKNIVSQLLENGKVIRPYIGISIQDLNRHLAEYLRYDGILKGAVVIGIAKGSPADDSDLRPKDIILKADGKDLSSSEELRKIIRNSKPGDVISLEIWRNGKNMSIAVTTAENLGN